MGMVEFERNLNLEPDVKIDFRLVTTHLAHTFFVWGDGPGLEE